MLPDTYMRCSLSTGHFSKTEKTREKILRAAAGPPGQLLKPASEPHTNNSKHFQGFTGEHHSPVLGETEK